MARHLAFRAMTSKQIGFRTAGMSRFRDYKPSRMMIEAVLAVNAARHRLREERLARNTEQNTRQPVPRTEGGDTDPEGGGQAQAGACACGKREK
jgi:hypothetical protein